MPRIMLVDTNPATCRAAVAVLQRAHYQVETCREPGAAFTRACQAPPDLVILDVPASQPRVGYQALDRLKQQEETQAIPILLAAPTPDALAGAGALLEPERWLSMKPAGSRSAATLMR